jgi:hypothetical protein
MSAIALRQAFGRAARVLGSRAESTAAAALSSTGPVPSNDPIMRPYYEELARMEVAPAASAREQSPSERAVRRLPLPPPLPVMCLRSSWSATPTPAMPPSALLINQQQTCSPG